MKKILTLICLFFYIGIGFAGQSLLTAVNKDVQLNGCIIEKNDSSFVLKAFDLNNNFCEAIFEINNKEYLFNEISLKIKKSGCIVKLYLFSDTYIEVYPEIFQNQEYYFNLSDYIEAIEKIKKIKIVLKNKNNKLPIYKHYCEFSDFVLNRKDFYKRDALNLLDGHTAYGNKQYWVSSLNSTVPKEDFYLNADKNIVWKKSVKSGYFIKRYFYANLAEFGALKIKLKKSNCILKVQVKQLSSQGHFIDIAEIKHNREKTIDLRKYIKSNKLEKYEIRLLLETLNLDEKNNYAVIQEIKLEPPIIYSCDYKVFDEKIIFPQKEENFTYPAESLKEKNINTKYERSEIKVKYNYFNKNINIFNNYYKMTVDTKKGWILRMFFKDEIFGFKNFFNINYRGKILTIDQASSFNYDYYDKTLYLNYYFEEQGLSVIAKIVFSEYNYFDIYLSIRMQRYSPASINFPADLTLDTKKIKSIFIPMPPGFILKKENFDKIKNINTEKILYNFDFNNISLKDFSVCFFSHNSGSALDLNTNIDYQLNNNLEINKHTYLYTKTNVIKLEPVRFSVEKNIKEAINHYRLKRTFKKNKQIKIDFKNFTGRYLLYPVYNYFFSSDNFFLQAFEENKNRYLEYLLNISDTDGNKFFSDFYSNIKNNNISDYDILEKNIYLAKYPYGDILINLSKNNYIYKNFIIPSDGFIFISRNKNKISGDIIGYDGFINSKRIRFNMSAENDGINIRLDKFYNGYFCFPLVNDLQNNFLDAENIINNKMYKNINFAYFKGDIVLALKQKNQNNLKMDNSENSFNNIIRIKQGINILPDIKISKYIADKSDTIFIGFDESIKEFKILKINPQLYFYRIENTEEYHPALKNNIYFNTDADENYLYWLKLKPKDNNEFSELIYQSQKIK